MLVSITKYSSKRNEEMSIFDLLMLFTTCIRCSPARRFTQQKISCDTFIGLSWHHPNIVILVQKKFIKITDFMAHYNRSAGIRNTWKLQNEQCELGSLELHLDAKMCLNRASSGCRKKNNLWRHKKEHVFMKYFLRKLDWKIERRAKQSKAKQCESEVMQFCHWKHPEVWI